MMETPQMVIFEQLARLSWHGFQMMGYNALDFFQKGSNGWITATGSAANSGR
jgi:hypothetical protein